VPLLQVPRFLGHLIYGPDKISERFPLGRPIPFVHAKDWRVGNNRTKSNSNDPMKTRTSYALGLCAALLLSPLTPVLAQSTWQTVDNPTPWRGRDIVCDANGSFISLAIDNIDSSSGPVSTAVRVSVDHGTNWQTAGSIAGYALDLAVAPDGTLFASGNRTATVSGRAVVWQSLDHGATWTQSEPWAGQTTKFLCLDIAAGNSGAVYLCGYIYAGGQWLVRKGQQTANGLIWSTVDAIAGNQAGAVCVQPGPAGQPDVVIVGGQVSGLWTVRRSSDGGASWLTVDSYSGNPTAVTVAPEGSIYVFGKGAFSTTVTNTTVVGKKVKTTITTTSQTGWLVRKSSTAGGSWTNVDFVASGWPVGSITADIFGRVFAVGWMQGATSDTWLVRGSADFGATWSTTDLFLPADTTRSHAQAVACDGLGNVCVIGETGTNTTTYAAPIRRLAGP
jgi:hypothetical protein